MNHTWPADRPPWIMKTVAGRAIEDQRKRPTRASAAVQGDRPTFALDLGRMTSVLRTTRINFFLPIYLYLRLSSGKLYVGVFIHLPLRRSWQLWLRRSPFPPVAPERSRSDRIPC